MNGNNPVQPQMIEPEQTIVQNAAELGVILNVVKNRLVCINHMLRGQEPTQDVEAVIPYCFIAAQKENINLANELIQITDEIVSLIH